MDILNTTENLESLKQRVWRRYRYIQGIESSKRDLDDLAFLENFKIAVRMWDWTWDEEVVSTLPNGGQIGSVQLQGEKDG
jgi:hypothetical protein